MIFFINIACVLNKPYKLFIRNHLRFSPAAEFAKDENNNLKMKACNGILMLKFV